jgi:hypothetical protein
VRNIRSQHITPVSEHFNMPDHNIGDLKFMALISNEEWTTAKRRQIESKWIKKLASLSPLGINIAVNTNLNKYVSIPFKGRNSIPISLNPFLEDELVTVSYTTGSPLRVLFNHKHRIARDC